MEQVRMKPPLARLQHLGRASLLGISELPLGVIVGSRATRQGSPPLESFWSYLTAEPGSGIP